jgi:hypothetical protein
MKAIAIFNKTRIYNGFYYDEPGAGVNQTAEAKEEDEDEYQALLSRAVSNSLSMTTKNRLLELQEKRQIKKRGVT